MPEISSHRYVVVDVFTNNKLEGNPLAVFPEGPGFDTQTMQRIARELNLSETVFIFPPTSSDAVAKLRIFTPGREMDFAGHPTVGTSYVLMDQGTVPRDCVNFVLEENVGPVPVRVEQNGENRMFWLTTPPIQDGAKFDRALCAEVLGLQIDEVMDLPPQLLSAGNPTVLIPLKTKESVDRAWLDLSGARKLRGDIPQPICNFVFTPTPEGAYSRMFAPEHGLAEDPATGSSTGPLASYMLRHGLASTEGGTHFVSEQGTKMLRRSLLHVHVMGDGGINGIEVGGNVVPIISGILHL